jgi:hypothetical protein
MVAKELPKEPLAVNSALAVVDPTRLLGDETKLASVVITREANPSRELAVLFSANSAVISLTICPDKVESELETDAVLVIVLVALPVKLASLLSSEAEASTPRPACADILAS